MARVVTIEAIYPDDPDSIFAGALDLAEMKQAMAGIARYEGLPDGVITEGDTHTVDVLMWGWMRTRGYVMRVERLDRTARVLQSREHNPQVSRWDHTLSLSSHPQGALWTDRIVLEAGWQTRFTAMFCRYVYSHRHKARNASSITASIARGFD